MTLAVRYLARTRRQGSVTLQSIQKRRSRCSGVQSSEIPPVAYRIAIVFSFGVMTIKSKLM